MTPYVVQASFWNVVVGYFPSPYNYKTKEVLLSSIEVDMVEVSRVTTRRKLIFKLEAVYSRAFQPMKWNLNLRMGDELHVASVGWRQ